MYRFKPATENGIPVPKQINIEVNFKIMDSPDAGAGPQAQPRIVVARSPDQELYDRGVNAIADGWYEQGRQVLETLVNTYPDSPYAARAKLAIAQSVAKEKSAGSPVHVQGPKGDDEVVLYANAAGPQEYNGIPVRKVGGGVTAPVPIQVSEPDYTKEARKAKLKGIVVVSLVVDVQGMPQNVQVLYGLGMGLDQKAVDAVKQYKFKPGMLDGNPVPVKISIEVNFQLF
jgi:TonB family protein